MLAATMVVHPAFVVAPVRRRMFGSFVEAAAVNGPDAPDRVVPRVLAGSTDTSGTDRMVVTSAVASRTMIMLRMPQSLDESRLRLGVVDVLPAP